MKTRRLNKRGGGKAKPMNELNALTRRMESLRFGTRKTKAPRFGAKSTKRVLPRRRHLKTIQMKKSKKPVATLRRFVRSGLVVRPNIGLDVERFEPADYIRKVGNVFKGLGAVRARIETAEKIELLDDFDIIILNIYEGLPKIRRAMGESENEEMNASNENVDDMLEEIEEVGKTLIQQSKEYRKRVRNTSRNISNIQVSIIAIAEATNRVLLQSVAKLAKPNRNNSPNINALVSQLGAMNMKESSVDDLSSLLAGLGL